MDMIQVDPKLFVTCRLCLEDLGQYQIVPIVRDQMKYCYDIVVEPYDGLPQLICLKCKEVLNNFFTVKKNLCEKQLNLRRKVQISNKGTDDITNIQPQQDTVSSSQQVTDNIEETIKPKQKSKRIIHSSDSETSSNVTLPKRRKNLRDTHGSSTTRVKWVGAGFKKELVCTICNAKWPQLISLLNHHRSHTKLKTVYSTVLNKKCSVNLIKIDNLDNFTGMNNIVVHDDSKIIENCNSPFYYIRYEKEKQGLTNNHLFGDDSSESLLEDSSTKHMDPESEQDEQDVITRPKRRNARILTRSSNETLVIESNGNKVMSDNEDSKLIRQINKVPLAPISNDQCISIDDSSDSDTGRNEIESTHSQKPALKAKLFDLKNIQGIINTCDNAYQRKYEGTEKSVVHSELQLRRKILGIGRKTISKQSSFNGTGLRKFMEYKNLSITWLLKGTHSAKDSNYIRIITKLRGNGVADPNQGWGLIPVPGPLPDIAAMKKPDNVVPTAVQQPTENLINKFHSNMDSAVIYFNNSSDHKNKLLNANPVANPKQLPRKATAANELRINKVVSEPCTSFHNNEDTDLCMPIITSTTSLAVPNIAEQLSENIIPVINTHPETMVPRIKVKPVTEMMSERVLNILREQSATVSTSNILHHQTDNQNTMMRQIENTNTALTQIEKTNNIVLTPNVWVPQSIPNIFTSHIVPQITATSQPMQLVQISCVNPVNVAPTLTYQNMTPPTMVHSVPTNDAKNKNEFVLLSTAELPNTKTNSPFGYLKNLSRMHNLVLIDPHETLSRDFICLIKFKVQFKQEPIDEPVVLCLSLFCNQNKFCFTVRDRNQKDININKISPNWQWEIIKIFRGGDLVDKLQENAQKHSRETYEYTKNFLALLKSITFQKLP